MKSTAVLECKHADENAMRGVHQQLGFYCRLRLRHQFIISQFFFIEVQVGRFFFIYVVNTISKRFFLWMDDDDHTHGARTHYDTTTTTTHPILMHAQRAIRLLLLLLLMDGIAMRVCVCVGKRRIF